MSQRVEPLGDPWICDHGDHMWVIHRSTEHDAWRSLRAHLKGCGHVAKDGTA